MRALLPRPHRRLWHGSRDGRRHLVAVLRGAQPGAATEDQQVRQRVAAEAVRAVHPAGHLAGRKESLDVGGCPGVRVDLNTAHDVVAGGTDLHRLGGDVDIGQFFELVVHRRQLAADDIGRQPARDVEEDSTVR